MRSPSVLNRLATLRPWLLVLGVALLQGCAVTRQVTPVAQPTIPALSVPGAGVGADPRAPFIQHRYKVEAVRFDALDESSYDSPWWNPWASDEIVMFFEAPQYRTLLGSRIYEDVDSGENRSFKANESCILPVDGANSQQDTTLSSERKDTWLCAGAGAPAPLGFQVGMWEADGELAQVYARCFSSYGGLGGCAFRSTSYLGPDYADDLVDRRTLVFTDEQLIAKLPNVNDTVEETIALDRCQHDTICGYGPLAPSGPSYTFTYRITRMRDVQIIPTVQP